MTQLVIREREGNRERKEEVGDGEGVARRRKEGKEREKKKDERRPLQLFLGAVTSMTGLLSPPLEPFKKGASVPGGLGNKRAGKCDQEAGGSRHNWGI